MKKKQGKKIIARIVLFTFIFLNIPFDKFIVQATERTDINLTNLAYYNLIVFGNCEMTDSRIEGALAVGKDINVKPYGNGNPEVCGFISKGADVSSSLVIGKNKNLSPVEEPLEDDKCNPSLILGGNINLNNSGKTLNAWSNKECPIVVGETEYNSINEKITINDQERDIEKFGSKVLSDSFNTFKSNTNNYISKVNALNGNNIGEKFKISTVNSEGRWGEISSDIKLSSNKGNLNDSKDQSETIFTKINSSSSKINIKGGIIPDSIGSAKVGESGENALKNLIIISDAEIIDFDNSNWQYNSEYLVNSSDMTNNMLTVSPKNKTVKRLSQHITWVFPKAKEINKTGGDILGSVIAPNANLNVMGGNIVGQVIVKGLKQTRGGDFCSLLDRESLSLKNKTVLYGDKVDFKDLLGNCILDENILSSYKFEWVNKSNKVFSKGKMIKENNKISFEYDNGSKGEFNPKNTDVYTLKITNTQDSSIEIKASSKVKVLKPKIVLSKKVLGDKDNKEMFSFNLKENYKGKTKTFITSSEWNGDVSVKNPITLINISRGEYKLSERTTQGYNLKNVSLEGENFDINSKFIIGQNGNNVTLNGNDLIGDEPIINITVSNNYNKLDFYHSTDVLRNNFNK